MIREIAAALGGVLSGLGVFLVVLFDPGVTNSANVTNTGLYGPRQISVPISGPETLRFSSGVSGVYSGILSGLLLLLLALGAGIIVAYMGLGRLRGEGIS